METKMTTWTARLKKLRVLQGDFCKQVPVSQSYFSELCSGKLKNPSLEKFIRIENLILAMERREEQKAARRAAAKPRPTKQDRPKPKPRKA